MAPDLTDFVINWTKMLYCMGRFRDYVHFMDWQQFVSLGIVAATAVLLAWGRWRHSRSVFGRRAHCGCATAGSAAAPGSIVFHARKGGRAGVIVKMN